MIVARVLKFAFVLLALTAGPTASALAENAKPYSGMVTIETGKPFKPYVKALKGAIKANKFNIVGLACANCAAKSQGVTIPGNRVFLFFRPDYAVRMLSYSTAAGIEAPIRVYVTETEKGTARVTYRLPSHVFGAYEISGLKTMGAELDGHVKKILDDAGASSG